MRISTQTFFDRTGSSMNSLQQKVFQVQEKLAAGTKFLTPSDDPVASARALRVSQSMAETSQYAASRARAAQSLSLEEGALQMASGVMQSIKELVVQAGNGALADGDRASVATALEGRFSELLGIANSDDGNGQYLFGGFKSDAPPFVQQGDGSVLYRGDSGSLQMQIDVARRIGATDDGDAVFRSVQGGAGYVTSARATNAGSAMFKPAYVADGRNYQVEFAGGNYTVTAPGLAPVSGPYVSGAPIVAGGLQITFEGVPADGDTFMIQSAADAGTDVFQALRDVIDALRTPLASAGAQGHAALGNALSTANVKLANAYDNILTVRSSVGSRMSEIESLDASGSWRGLVDQTYLSELQDLDYASAIAEFSQRYTNLQATQQTFARLQGIALFNYL